MKALRHGDRWVVAIGGNALADPHDPMALAHQDQRADMLAGPLVEAVMSGKRLVMVHGNGPQVGARLIQSEAGRLQAPPLPLHVLVAETQGQIGHYVGAAISRELARRGRTDQVACLVTHVVVHPDAPEFANPDKPVGLIYSLEEGTRLAHDRAWVMREVAGGGMRRVVPSPRPLEVVEQASIGKLMEAGVCVIAGGGGGVPVARGNGGFHGVDAVVDKDYTAERIAAGLGAARLVILTDVPGAALSFGKAGQEYLRTMTTSQAREHVARQEFAPGSMAPKVEACVEFVEGGGHEAVIAATYATEAALLGNGGTRIIAG
ncbi:MAG TPA: carbamate kinase [Dehalococcoidia bacterium]|nr:carbamate kinase [Dehalococcoidia bacterium]